MTTNPSVCSATVRDITFGLLAVSVLSVSSAGSAREYPDVPEPMVFDMVRPLGAKRGELEINALAQKNVSGPQRKVEWAPEIEYAFANGFAVELELPIEGLTVTDYKMGLQATFGTFAGRRGVHGIQYLGLYNRASRRWESTIVYLVGFRFDERWSTMSMIGTGNVTLSSPSNRNLIVNHTTFYALSHAAIAGVEINTRRGGRAYTLVMPQMQFGLSKGLTLQTGVGAEKDTDQPWRPRAGLRLIKQF